MSKVTSVGRSIGWSVGRSVDRSVHCSASHQPDSDPYTQPRRSLNASFFRKLWRRYLVFPRPTSRRCGRGKTLAWLSLLLSAAVLAVILPGRAGLGTRGYERARVGQKSSSSSSEEETSRTVVHGNTSRHRLTTEPDTDPR